MKMKMRNILLISGTVLGVFLLAYPFFSGKAQKIEGTDKTLQQNASLNIIEKNATAKSLYDKLQQGEKEKNKVWALIQASEPPMGIMEVGAPQIVSNLILSLKNGKTTAWLTIIEFAVGSKRPVSQGIMMVSQGIIKDCKGGLCGDGGRKIYGTKGEFVSLQFNKDNYDFYISCDSEKTAMRFAGYAIKAIAEK